MLYTFKLYQINYELINIRKVIIGTLCKFKTLPSRIPTKQTKLSKYSYISAKVFLQNRHDNRNMSNIYNSIYL